MEHADPSTMTRTEGRIVESGKKVEMSSSTRSSHLVPARATAVSEALSWITDINNKDEPQNKEKRPGKIDGHAKETHRKLFVK